MSITIALRQVAPGWSFSCLVPRPILATEGAQPAVGGRLARWEVRMTPKGTIKAGRMQCGCLAWETQLSQPTAPQGLLPSLLPALREWRRQWAEAVTPSRLDQELARRVGVGRGSSRANPAAGGPTCNSASSGASSSANSNASSSSSSSSPFRISGLGPTPLGLPLPDFDTRHSFCVAGDAGLEVWLYWALAAFGFPVRESTDFMATWLPRMAGAPWLLITFADVRNHHAVSQLTVDCQLPSSVLRLFMLFERLDAPVEAHGDLHTEAAGRVGKLQQAAGRRLTVLEWGGMEVVRQPGAGARAW